MGCTQSAPNATQNQQKPAAPAAKPAAAPAAAPAAKPAAAPATNTAAAKPAAAPAPQASPKPAATATTTASASATTTATTSQNSPAKPAAAPAPVVHNHAAAETLVKKVDVQERVDVAKTADRTENVTVTTVGSHSPHTPGHHEVVVSHNENVTVNQDVKKNEDVNVNTNTEVITHIETDAQGNQIIVEETVVTEEVDTVIETETRKEVVTEVQETVLVTDEVAVVRTTPSGPPATKKGMIFKQGHVVKNWKNRFFVLENGVMSYYENNTMKDKKGDFNLKGVKLTVDKTIVKLVGSDNGANAKGQNELIMEIKYPNERNDWVAAIQSHIDYYSK